MVHNILEDILLKTDSNDFLLNFFADTNRESLSDMIFS